MTRTQLIEVPVSEVPVPVISGVGFSSSFVKWATITGSVCGLVAYAYLFITLAKERANV